MKSIGSIENKNADNLLRSCNENFGMQLNPFKSSVNKISFIINQKSSFYTNQSVHMNCNSRSANKTNFRAIENLTVSSISTLEPSIAEEHEASPSLINRLNPVQINSIKLPS